MAGNIKGITVEIGGDTTKLQSALSNVNKDIKNTQSSLKDVERLLKLDPTNTELLAQKQRLLAERINEAKTKLDALKQAQEKAKAMLASGDIDQGAYDKLSRDVIAAQQALDQLSENADDATGGLEGNEEAAEEATKSHEGLKNALAATGAALAAVATAAAAGAVELGKSVVGSFAEFEQLSGGVEKIFGDASDAVMEFAQAASSTAGLSANDYMETVTGFSASLIQGLEGDTAKAAEIADQAIRDMSDNANTFGTDIESIQNAYQGFAKGNFTMLDNLKLGYGGTKEEMVRLINESGTLEKQIESVDEVSFDQIINAIHKVQENQKIAGTTAAEAAKTISGSIGTMTADWRNFLTALGTGEGIDDALGRLQESFTNVINNIQPVIERLIAALPGVLQTILPMIMSMLPGILETISGLFSQILAALIQAIPMLTPAIVQIVQSLVTTLIENAPLLITSALELITQLAAGLIESLPVLAAGAIEVVTALISYFLEQGPSIIESGMIMLTELVTGIINNLPELINGATETVNTMLNTILDNLPAILDMGGTMLVQIVQGIITNLPEIVLSVAEMIITFTGTIIEHLPEILESGVGIIVELVAGIAQANSQIVEAISQVASGVVDTLKEKGSEFIDAGKNIIDGLVQGIIDNASAVWDAVTQVASDAWGAVTDFFDIASPSKKMRDEIGKNIDAGWAIGLEKYSGMITDAARSLNEDVYDELNSTINPNIQANMSRTANLTLTTPVYLDGRVITSVVNQQLGVLL